MNIKLKLNCNKDSIILQYGETEDYKWMTETEFIKFVYSKKRIENKKQKYWKYYKGT